MRIAAAVLLTSVMAWGCSGPTNPEERLPGPAAMVTMDSVTVYPGASISLPIRMSYPSGGHEQLDTLGSFDFRIIYDSAILTHLAVVQGESISEWEYFTYRWGDRRLCFDCSLASLEVVAVRDLDNHAPVVPPQAYPEGPLFSLDFQASSDWNHIDSTTAIMFAYSACGDNTFSPQSDQRTYYCANPQFGYESEEAAFDTMGCARAVTIKPVLSFQGGRVTIVEPPPRRGDLDLDGTPFTVPDLMRFGDLFWDHTSARNSSLIPHMIVRSDCNGDGKPLTIADYEYLFRASFVGLDTSSALPPPFGESVHFELQPDGQDWLIGGTSTSAISALDLKILEPSGTPLEAEWISGRWNAYSAVFFGDTLRIVAIPELDDLLESNWRPPIRITGTGEIHPVIVSAQAATPPGVLMDVSLKP